MERLETRLEGPILIAPRVIGDERGFFCETYRRSVFSELGIPEEMVQDNHSRSRRGVVRGMHLQVGDGVAKLIRCARGAILDVVVDVRHRSPTFGEWEAFELTDENMRLVYCPVGFAHGFCTLEPDTEVEYKVSAFYSREHDMGIHWNDPALAIAWPVAPERATLSDKDKRNPVLAELPRVFSYPAR